MIEITHLFYDVMDKRVALHDPADVRCTAWIDHEVRGRSRCRRTRQRGWWACDQCTADPAWTSSGPVTINGLTATSRVNIMDMRVWGYDTDPADGLDWVAVIVPRRR